MLPQTNLQLYRVLMERGVCAADLAAVRRAYDLARELFSRSYRPSHKPFVAHLVGVAGALGAWDEPIETVLAGLLHSAYLYGDFGDGLRSAAEPRRRIVRSLVGEPAESLIEHYTRLTWSRPASEYVDAARRGELDRALVVMKLADVCDECADGGLRYAVGKPLAFDLADDRQSFFAAVGSLIGGPARAMVEQLVADGDRINPPAALRSVDRSFHSVTGLGETRRSWGAMRWRRITQRLRSRKAG